jgi:hypothetical protein
MRKVFLSYAYEDAEAASRVRQALEKVDVSGFLDSADISAGNAIAKDMRKALADASAFIVLLSPSALRSQWVQFELGAAVSLGKPLVPVLVEDIEDKSGLPDLLRDRVWLDARRKSPAEIASALSTALDARALASG